MRWTLCAMLLAIAIVASALGVYQCFWDASHPNHPLLLGIFILLICVTVVAAISATSRKRAASLGSALFGIAYLICVLKCGFGLETIDDSRWLSKNTLIGFALYGISFLASHLCIMVMRPSETVEQLHSKEPSSGPVSNGL